MDNLFTLLISAMIVNNVIFSRFLGICPYLGVSKSQSTAIGMSLAVIFVMALSGSSTYLVYYFVLVPLSVEYLITIAFILVIAGLVQFVEIFMKKTLPDLYQALGIYLPLITTNCAVLGIAILNVNEGFDLIENLVYSVGSAAGFGLAINIFAGIRERIELADIPKNLQGVPIALLTASILSMAFMGFAGLGG